MSLGQWRKRALVFAVVGASIITVAFGPGEAADAAAPVPTRTEAYHPVFTLEGPQPIPLEVNARLFNANTNAKVAGKLIYFSSMDGRPEFCRDATNNFGFARCNIPFSMVRSIIENGYRASFRGDAAFAPSFDIRLVPLLAVG